MRKSREVPITLLAALALSATGCKDAPKTRNCVDAQGRIVPDANCNTSSTTVPYHYIYGGASGGHMGDEVVGGSSSSGEEGVSRGGFGHGNAAGEGGGE